MENLQLGTDAGKAAGLVRNLEAQAKEMGARLFHTMIILPGFGRQVRFCPQASSAVRRSFSFTGKLPWQL
jgi:hypothetical protein